MKTSDFSFLLPPHLIAQTPIANGRDQSKLMVVNKKTKTIAHHHFFELPRLLHAGDILVINNSKVFPARLRGHKSAMADGAAVELLLLREESQTKHTTRWEIMIKTRHPRLGLVVRIADDLHATLVDKRQTANHETWIAEFSVSAPVLRQLLARIGETPVPPYIHQQNDREKFLRQQYQTVYAKRDGSVAAPTAGLHFTRSLLNALQKKGVSIVEITLHVGLGTFAPVQVENLAHHRMHPEYIEISPRAATIITEGKKSGARIIAVGTTAVRTLESQWHDTALQSGNAWTKLFITPGYTFQCVDAMITNFHLPQSTLVMLVCAFGGYDLVMRAYREAIEKNYRFFSFGDAMLIE